MCMKSQITKIDAVETENAFNGINVCFYIEASPIVENKELDGMSEEELNDLLESGDITNVFNSSRNISPFRTILFPNDERVMKLFGKIWEKGKKAMEKGEKPTYPTINLNRFEVEAPEPYFRRYVNDNEDNGIKAGDWILAEEGDETDETDEKGRKLFRTIWVTSTCKTDTDGKDTPIENTVRKAKRAWVNGLETDAGTGKMFTPAKKQLEKERQIAAAKKAKQNDHEGGDEALVQGVTKGKKKLSFEDD